MQISKHIYALIITVSMFSVMLLYNVNQSIRFSAVDFAGATGNGGNDML